MSPPFLQNRIRWGHGLLVLILVLSDAATVRATGQTQDAPPDGAEQFATLCARCHGLTGDGQGAEVLDRPARDFTAGGFSFGNTQEAIARTITHGIPGSPMPAFGETLAPEVITALAQHVRTLAPGAEEPAEAETILTVRDHPVVVRGGLPPITEGAPDHPRGLLLGLPGGLGFEYRVKDLALLGVRMGDFVRRADWTGRGGSSLDPLGQLLWLNERGTPGATAEYQTGPAREDRENAPLVAQLRATATPATGASISWDAMTSQGAHVAHVDEELRALTTSLGAGFARVFHVSGPRLAGLVLRQGVSPGQPVQLVDTRGIVVQRDDGTYELCVALVDAPLSQTSVLPDGVAVTLLDGNAGGSEGETATITFVTLFSSEWAASEPDVLSATLRAELAR